MSEINRYPSPDLLDRALGELRDAPIQAGPPDDLAIATISAARARLAGGSFAMSGKLACRRWSGRILPYVGAGTAAALVLAVATTGAFLWLGGSSAQATFLRAMDNAVRAKTVRFTWTQTNGPPGQNGKFFTTDRNGNVRVYDSSSELVLKVTAIGACVRIDSGEVSTRLEDYTCDTVLVLDHKYKLARRFEAGGKEGDFYGLFARLAKLKPQDVKPAGEEMIGSLKTMKFELAEEEKSGVIAGAVWKGATWTVWIDPKTDLPVRLRYMKDENLKWEFTDFVWNEPADDALFEQEIPPGYEPIENSKEPESPTLEDGRTVYIRFVQPAMERVRQAKSVVYTRTHIGPNKDLAPLVVTSYLQSGAAREEYSNGVSILSDGTLLAMTHSTKTYRKAPSRIKLKSATEVLDQLVGIKDESAKDLGHENVGGVMAQKYEVKVGEPGAGTSTLWVDPKSGLPVKVHFVAEDRKVFVTLEKFRWNEDLDPKLFGLDPPAGYTPKRE
jgi:outer membrane lipoprotein-sorting protein